MKSPIFTVPDVHKHAKQATVVTWKIIKLYVSKVKIENKVSKNKKVHIKKIIIL